ncbi:TetR/AcrR family transcriptional regulator [Actinomadura parmotrematis]|uniref:TetR/AcrR family transcriptional regulator n=1 Tax=Actinomadura parmotrematis TaxID=2864039 RepID=UPI00215DBE7F|nr:helix-turn-helix domain-containing protein [Actinomadura parmotrematis]
MSAFWTAGYEATSTEDLCAVTGVGRSSLYNAFAGKRELFLRALRRYRDAGRCSGLQARGEGARREGRQARAAL